MLEFLASFSFYFVQIINNVMIFIGGDLLGTIVVVLLFSHVRLGPVYLEDLLF